MGVRRRYSAVRGRPRLEAMLDYARAGDALVVTAFGRLGRSVAEVTRTMPTSVSAESSFAPYQKESTPPHRPVVLSLRS
jgi:hypothetical protein